MKDFENCDNRTLLSGIVEFPKNYIKKFNHIKFRNSKHFKNYEINKNFKMKLDNIVAMNMGFIKSDYSKKSDILMKDLLDMDLKTTNLHIDIILMDLYLNLAKQE